MGGKSKAQTVGYKYYLGMHLGLCHGPIDNISRLRCDDRDAWNGTNTGGTINVNAGDLFGGDKREGGVSGAIDVAMGGPAQGKNSYLVSKLGNLIPAYRGVVGLIFRQCYLGNNPYLKPWSARGQRIHLRQDGIAQWYDAKAEVSSSTGIPANTLWRYLVTLLTDGTDYSSPSFDDSAWAVGKAPFTNGSYGGGPVWDGVGTTVPSNRQTWMRKTFEYDKGIYAGASFTVNVDDHWSVWINGNLLGSGGSDGLGGVDYIRTMVIPDNYLVTGTNLVVIRARDSYVTAAAVPMPTAI